MKKSSFALLSVSALAALFALTNRGAAQVVPPPPQPVSKPGVARCASRVGAFKSQNIQDKKQVVYSPQPGWALVSYHVVDEGAFGNTSESWTSVPGGFTYVSSYHMTDVYNEAFNLVASASLNGKDLGDINAALTNSYNYSSTYHDSIMSSHSSVTLMTNARGRGTLNDKGSACAIRLDVVEIQIDPNFQSGAQFRAFILKKTQDAIAAARAIAKGGSAGLNLERRSMPHQPDRWSNFLPFLTTPR